MISIVYGSPVAGWPNNWAASSADLANDAPNICEMALPTTHSPPRLPFSRSMGSPGQTVLRHARPPIVMQ
jgi:hypothetical protein